MKVETIVLGSVETNCYIIYNEAREAVMIDPADDGERLLKKLDGINLKLQAILLTHGHFDHIMAVNEVRDATGAKCYASADEEELLLNTRKNCSVMMSRPYTVKPDILLSDGQELELMGERLKVISTPGHTAGSVCYYFVDEASLFCGDTLFFESVGRTDLPTGNGQKLLSSINGKLLSLPDNVRIYPGHGAPTAVGHEKQYNPFIYGGHGND